MNRPFVIRCATIASGPENTTGFRSACSTATSKRTTIEPPSAAKRWHRDYAQLDPTSPTGHFYLARKRTSLLEFDNDRGSRSIAANSLKRGEKRAHVTWRAEERR